MTRRQHFPSTWKTTLTISTILMLCLGSACSVHSLAKRFAMKETMEGDARRLPPGFRFLPPTDGNGGIILAHLPRGSAQAMLTSTMDALATYFDQRPKLVSAIASDDGNNLQAGITSRLKNQSIRGITFIEATEGDSVVAILYDRADRFQDSFTALHKQLIASLPQPKAPPKVSLQRQQLPDHSGFISVPAGWQVNANNAMVSAEGPQGNVDLGLYAQVYTPEAAAYFPMRPPLVAAYGDPGRAVQELMAQMHITNAPNAIRIVQRTPFAWADNGIGELLHLQAEINGQQREGIALVLEKMTGGGTWMYYYSAVHTTREAFARNLPVLIEIWKSWKTDDRVFQERLTQAMRSMNRVSQIIQEVNAGRQAAMERSSTAWDHYIRGTWPIEDRDTGSRYVAQEDTALLVRQMNEAEHYERWRVVPYEELNR